MTNIYSMAEEAANYISLNTSVTPKVAIILGSGLSALAKSVSNPINIKYNQIPHFPSSTIQGHPGILTLGEISNLPILAMQGRFHYYEGHELSSTTFAIRVLSLLGVRNLIITNAAGGINKKFKAGDIMLIRDHIGLFSPSPLRGPNIDEFGPRFLDLSQAYNTNLLNIGKKASKSLKIDIKEGVYAYLPGPSYETPADVKALEILGADAVGMSTVPEVIVARHCGIKVIGISCITNMTAGITKNPLDHSEVINTSKQVETKFTALIKEILRIMASQEETTKCGF